MSQFKIAAQPNVIDDHLLDIIGNEFKFDHAKGLAEWLKNSADAYTREDIPDDEQVMLIEIIEGAPKRNSTFRGISAPLEVAIEKKTTGASCPWNLSTVPTRAPSGSRSRRHFTCAL